MASGVTEKYDLAKPEVGGSQNTWGDELNANMDRLDQLLFNRVVKTATERDAAAENPQIMDLHLRVPLQAAGKTALELGGEGMLAANASWVESAVMRIMDRFIPVGTIVLWSGSVASWTALNDLGWILCLGVL